MTAPTMDREHALEAVATSPEPDHRQDRDSAAVWMVPGTALTILAVLLLGFVSHVSVIGSLRHARDQQTSYANFRAELAQGTAPVGQADVNTGSLLALGTPVAVLSIPQLDLREVVFEGTTSGVLQRGAGHRRDTLLPGQAGVAVLMGRQAAFGGPFGQLATLGKGETFQVTTGQGVSVYRVLGVRRAGDPQPQPPEPGHGRLVLVTADGPTYTPTGVLRVDADLVTKPFPAPQRVISAGAIPAAERPMAGDPSVWVAMVLWAQALVLAVLGLAWARARWGRWQTWVVAVPVLAALGLAVAGQASQLLPNLL